MSSGRHQLDMQQAAAKLVTEVSYGEAQRLFGALTGISLGSEQMHTITNHAAEGLTVLDMIPTRDEIGRRIAEVAAGCLRCLVLVLGIEGAYGPTRPAIAPDATAGAGSARG